MFVALDQSTAQVADARISAVDSVTTPSWKNGHPFWVRVKPGTHRFAIVSKANYQFSGPLITWNEGRREITIPEMKPRHVYIARYHWVQQRPAMQIEDLGENPDFSLVFGLPGVNDNRYRAEF
ncbi:hypothetical protein [Roseateles sp. L2-2]|uniref:hypothetical protein n=1 Tax=Roseateles sp. L2-2 TaxID=3422597 RepID=UPI003D36CCB5